MKYAIVIIVVICIIAILIPVSRHENAQTPVEKETVSDATLVIETAERIGDDISSMNDAQRVVYTVYNYESEIMNGGLCQFFDNESGKCAPFVSEALNAIDAERHKALFDSFIADNAIDIDAFPPMISNTGYSILLMKASMTLKWRKPSKRYLRPS